MPELPFKVVIPSHHRPQEILKNPFYPIAHVVVNDGEQVDQYRAAADKAEIYRGCSTSAGSCRPSRRCATSCSTRCGTPPPNPSSCRWTMTSLR